MLDNTARFILEIRHPDTEELIARTARAVKAEDKLSWIWPEDIVV